MSIQTVDISPMLRDCVKEGLARIPSQYFDSWLYGEVLKCYLEEIQELQDAIVGLVEGMTLAKADTWALNVIGKIVGQEREYFDYTQLYYFAPDTDGVQPDNGRWWVYDAPQAPVALMDNPTYRQFIHYKILKNHNKFSSLEEIRRQIYDATGDWVGIETKPLFSGAITVHPTTSLTNKNFLDYNRNTEIGDYVYNVAYPTTASFDEIETKPNPIALTDVGQTDFSTTD